MTSTSHGRCETRPKRGSSGVPVKWLALVVRARALGKPTQPISGEDGQPITFMHLVAMREIGEAIFAELVTRQSGTIIDSRVNGDGAVPPEAMTDLGAPASE
jgi:hypothetical protein